MRRMYQAPFRASISRSIGARVCSTVAASVSSSPSAASEFRSASGRPMSLGMTLKSAFGGRREEADVEVGVEEQCRDIGAVEDVLQIVGGRALPLQRFLELAVEGGQLLVQRLQFLLRGQQLLVGRLVFLVDRQRLLVDRLLLFAGDFQVADGALQFGPRGFQLLLELGDPRRVAARRLARRALVRRRIVDEADQQQLLAVAADRLHLDAERTGLAVVG